MGWHRHFLHATLVSGLVVGCSSSVDDPGDDDDDVTATTDAGTEVPRADAHVPVGDTIYERCFSFYGDPDKPAADYDSLGAFVPDHCDGTGHQDIVGVEKLVFVGDSITAGTPPTLPADYYRAELQVLLEEKFGPLEVKDCSRFGARTDDLLLPPHEMIKSCLPTAEDKTTLVVFTTGGNDIKAIAKDALAGEALEVSYDRVDQAVDLLRDAVDWFFEDDERFPNGVYVVFANVYEYTDGEADLNVCPLAIFDGLNRPWPEGRDVFIYMQEEFMKVAVEFQVDMIFLSEDFCGHGFHAADPSNACYRGETAERWFDDTCIHPTPAGHDHIARMFFNVIDG